MQLEFTTYTKDYMFQRFFDEQNISFIHQHKTTLNASNCVHTHAKTTIAHELKCTSSRVGVSNLMSQSA